MLLLLKRGREDEEKEKEEEKEWEEESPRRIALEVGGSQAGVQVGDLEVHGALAQQVLPLLVPAGRALQCFLLWLTVYTARHCSVLLGVALYLTTRFCTALYTLYIFNEPSIH